ncbi:hypothetical protein D3C85_1171370 [compost metagenome]
MKYSRQHPEWFQIFFIQCIHHRVPIPVLKFKSWLFSDFFDLIIVFRKAGTLNDSGICFHALNHQHLTVLQSIVQTILYFINHIEIKQDCPDTDDQQ